MPLANALPKAGDSEQDEQLFPLTLAFCAECFLVQILESIAPEHLFRDYVYFSSFSDSFVRHARDAALRLIETRRLGPRSLVLEIASNDGYFLKNFVQAGIPVLGVDPARNIAEVATRAGVRTIPEFFSAELANTLVAQGHRADVILANNVMAHVPDINGVLTGIRTLLKADGVFVMETPYVCDLIDHLEFDTIYHEHLFYYSLMSLETLFEANGLKVVDVERIPTHGGSLRVSAMRREHAVPSDSVRELGEEERRWGVGSPERYMEFADRVMTLRDDLFKLVHRLKSEGNTLVAYGAAAKGTTLLNYVGIGRECLDLVVDRSTHKQGRMMPGVRLPIRAPEYSARDHARVRAAAHVEHGRRDSAAAAGVPQALRQVHHSGAVAANCVMSVSVTAAESVGRTGRLMHDLLSELYPICRSITGDGVRDTLGVIGRHIPLRVHEVPTGTKVLDWTIPNEWNIRDAWLKDPAGRTIVSFRDSNLHVVSYSAPVHRRLSLAELRPHLFSMPSKPDWIPYRTSYYEETWGFCLPHREVLDLIDGEYEAYIDSTLAPGSLTYGEFVAAGADPHEVLIACHTCHPSMANDSLSGVVLATFLADALSRRSLRYSYRVIFAPGTIGALTWLAQNHDAARRVAHGLVVTCVGDPGPFTYKRTRRGNAEIDRAVLQVLREHAAPHSVVDFTPYGGDERQFCSPGYNLAVGSLMRSPYWQFPEYHSSADALDVVTAEALEESLDMYLRVIDVLEGNQRYRNLQPFGEPQLGRRGLFRSLSGTIDARSREFALLWVLNQSDGQHSLLDIAERSGLSFATVRDAAELLRQHALLDLIGDEPGHDTASPTVDRSAAEA